MYFAMAESAGLLRELPARAGRTREGIDLHLSGSRWYPIPYDAGVLRTAWAAVRLIHPAPALAVTALSGALALILAREGAGPVDGAAVALTTAAVAGSQVFTGATNDLADQARDASLRLEKPLPSGDISASAALWIAAAGLAVQVAASGRLGTLPLVLGLAATGSALAYNLWLSRTPLSVVPYLVSFGILPLWVASAVGAPLERVAPAVVLVAPFAAAAHLENTIRDFDADAAVGSRSLAQVLGREMAHRVAIVLALGVGLVAGVALALGGQLNAVSLVLGVLGLLAIFRGANDPRRLWQGLLAAAVLWTVAWALGSG
jgi:4-hydroxybenzoate polyprenyltransferase